MSKTVFERLCEKLDAQGINGPIQMDSDMLNDLAMDSLDQVEMAMALEDEFEIEITDEEQQAMRNGKATTIRHVVEMVETKIKERAA